MYNVSYYGGNEMINVGILGATGYTGAILVSILKKHKEVGNIKLGSHSYVGQDFSDVYKAFKDIEDGECLDSDMNEFADECDVVFMALPHGVASKVVTKEVLEKTKVIDLGADFRLSDIDTYEEWYKTKHYGEDVLSESVYGLCEIERENIKGTRLLANPGCYTTCSILSLYPLVKEKLIDINSIIIDAKSGVSGAGRKAATGSLFCECNESIKVYGIGTHRHTPEIEEQLSKLGEDITLSFTPHLVPMNKGILTTIYANVNERVGESDIKEAYEKYYKDEYFIRLRETGDLPVTNYVKGTNILDTSFVLDKRVNRVIVSSVIDNLMKGASSQAVQNMNIMFGFGEKEGIDFVPMYI